jgi:hypothetical protein
VYVIKQTDFDRETATGQIEELGNVVQEKDYNREIVKGNLRWTIDNIR